MKRKTFIQQTALGTLASMTLPRLLAASPAKSSPFGRVGNIGIQLFSIPKWMEEAPRQTLERLAAMGYDEIELYGPYPFTVEAVKAQWESLAPALGFSASGFFGQDPRDFKVWANQAGLRIPSMHTDLDTLETRMTELGAAAQKMGASYVVLPAIPEARRQTLDDYKRMADTFNAIGAEAQRHGVRFGYHNHGYGLQPMEGTTPFEWLVENTDPENVFLEMDVFWTVAGKADPVEYLKKYAGRYRMLHLKDMKALQHFTGDGGTPQEWMALFPNMAPAGTGVLDLGAIVETALTTGVEHYFVEQDMAPNPEAELPLSHDYLDQL